MRDFGISDESPRDGDTPGSNGRHLYTATSLSLLLGTTINIHGPVDFIVTGNTSIALLSKLPKRHPGASEPTAPLSAQAPYKARPISFEPTRWDIFTLWASAHRRHLGIGGVLFGFAVATAYLLRLVSLNAEIDRQWLVVETALRDRYALVPGYVDGIHAYSDKEPFTFAMAQKGLTAWRAARTEDELVAAAAQMERVLRQVAKVMNRYDQDGPAKGPDEADSSAAFARLERQKEPTRRIVGELVLRYNATVEDFNGKVESVPGSWIAWAAHLHSRRTIFTAR